MKLPNFQNHEGMNNLRKIINAELIEYRWENSWDPLVLKLLNEWELGDLSFSDIDIADDGTFEYKWYKIVLYIRDQKQHYGYDKEYKFHFCNCQTISSARSNYSLNGRYVANRDKKFSVNIINQEGRMVKKWVEMDLRVCKNCLTSFNYKNYSTVNYYEKNQIYNNFTREEYFASFDSYVPHVTHTAYTLPENVYRNDWDEISKKMKKQKNYTCEDCGIYAPPWSGIILHTHHKDHNKWNNSLENLAVLCDDCHSEYHDHMKRFKKFR